MIKEVNNKTQNIPVYPDSFKLDGCVIADKINIANQFNTYFVQYWHKTSFPNPSR